MKQDFAFEVWAAQKFFPHLQFMKALACVQEILKHHKKDEIKTP